MGKGSYFMFSMNFLMFLLKHQLLGKISLLLEVCLKTVCVKQIRQCLYKSIISSCMYYVKIFKYFGVLIKATFSGGNVFLQISKYPFLKLLGISFSFNKEDTFVFF
jgi:hypothetical protein